MRVRLRACICNPIAFIRVPLHLYSLSMIMVFMILVIASPRSDWNTAFSFLIRRRRLRGPIQPFISHSQSVTSIYDWQPNDLYILIVH